MNKAMELLEQLANQLGVAVEYLWSTLVKQQYVEGVTNITMAGIGVIVVIVLLCCIPRLTRYAINQHKELAEDRRKNGTGFNGSYILSSYREDFYSSMKIVIPICGCVAFLVIAISTVIGVRDGIQQLLNPDYFALKEVLDAISAS